MITITIDPALLASGTAPTLTFDDNVKSISIGRDPACAVPLKPELTKLGRNHFEIRRAASGVELVVDRQHPVYVDGQRVIERMTLPMRQDIRLLDPMSGPVISVSVEKTGAAPVTEKDALVDSGTQMGHTKKLVRNVVLAGCLAAVGFGGFLGWDFWQRSQHEQALLADMNLLVSRMNEAEEQNINWPAVQARIKPSVYQVTFAPSDGGPPLHQGTAWVYSPTKLATNSHVAALFKDPTLQGRILLVPADENLSAVPVVNVEMHPAYLAYRKAVKATRQDGVVSPLANLGSYDVAFLQVPEGSVLGPPLTLAAEGATLSSGEPVAYLGYPERCARHVGQLHIKSGIISGTSDFLGTQADQDLIYHTAPGAGGASGSPLFNGKGEVVGVFSGGEPANPVEAVGKSVPEAPQGCGISGAATLYAQNVSLLRELEYGTAADREATRETQWRNSAFYKLNQDKVWAAVATLTEDPESSDYSTQRQGLKLASQNKSAIGSAVQTFSDLAPGEYVAFANVQPEDRVTLQATVAGKLMHVPAQVEGKPTAVFVLKETGDVVVTVAGVDARNVEVIVALITSEE